MLHIGLHKTGTTYLQQTWAANAKALRRSGVLHPGRRDGVDQRLAALDILGQATAQGAGRWAALTSRVADAPEPTALVSAEGLSVASPAQVRSIVGSFPGREVEVLVTCRDLGRALVSSWQELVKNDGTWGWREYADAVRDPARRGASPARGFWIAQDLPAILSTFARAVPPERIHVVVVPRDPTDPQALARSTAEVIGFDPARLRRPPKRVNTSLGTAGTEFVRRLNVELDHSLSKPTHDHAVKNVVVRAVVAQAADRRFGLQTQDLPWVREESARQIDWLRSCSCRIHGDLDELRPVAYDGPGPDEFTESDVARVGAVAAAALARRYATLWEPTSTPAAVGAGERAQAAVRGLSFRTRRLAAAAADHNRAAAALASAYLRGRGGDRPGR